MHDLEHSLGSARLEEHSTSNVLDVLGIEPVPCKLRWQDVWKWERTLLFEGVTHSPFFDRPEVIAVELGKDKSLVRSEYEREIQLLRFGVVNDFLKCVESQSYSPSRS